MYIYKIYEFVCWDGFHSNARNSTVKANTIFGVQPQSATTNDAFLLFSMGSVVHPSKYIIVNEI